MKYRWDKRYLYWGVTAFMVIAGSMLFYTLLTNMSGVTAVAGNIVNLFTPVIYGFVFAYLLSPVMNFFEKKWFRVLLNKIEARRTAKGKTRTEEGARQHTITIKKRSRAFGVLTTVILFLACLVGLVSAVLPQVLDSVRTLISSADTYIATIQDWNLGFLDPFPDAQAAVHEFMLNAPAEIAGWLQRNILPQMTDVVGSVTTTVWNTISALFNILLGLVFMVYLLHGKELFAAQSKKVLYSLMTAVNANAVLRYMRDIHKKFGGFVTGKLIECLIIGALMFVIMTIFGMPYVTLISVIIGVTNFIPFFGPFIGAIPCSLLILVVDPIQAVYFAVIILIIQQVDGNWLGPKILGENTGLSTFWVIFAIIVGGRMFGFIGLIVGIPLFSFAYAVIKARIQRKLEVKELPTDSNFYRNVSHMDSETGEFVLLENEKPKKEKKPKERKGLFKKKQKPVD